MPTTRKPLANSSAAYWENVRQDMPVSNATPGAPCCQTARNVVSAENLDATCQGGAASGGALSVEISGKPSATACGALGSSRAAGGALSHPAPTAAAASSRCA